MDHIQAAAIVAELNKGRRSAREYSLSLYAPQPSRAIRDDEDDTVEIPPVRTRLIEPVSVYA